MLIIPAIDLKAGKVVRLQQGNFAQQTVYSSDPVATARHWERQGARYLHVVDLDGARSGRVCHLEIIKKMRASVNIPIEFGGGIRQKSSIKQVLNCGVDKVVLGTKLQDERFLRNAFKEFKEKIIISIDVRDNIVRLDGWRRQYGGLNILELLLKLESIGFRQIIYTDIKRDGTLKGPNVNMIRHILKKFRFSVFASGGIASLADLSKLKILSKDGLAGVIIGKALYDGRFTLREALRYA